MKKLFNWDFANKLGIILGIIGGGYLMYRLINFVISGGPIMTIADYITTNPNEKVVTCTWFANHSDLQTATFLDGQLVPDARG